MEDAIYGGRVDNAFDLRVLRSYLRYVRVRKQYCTVQACPLSAVLDLFLWLFFYYISFYFIYII